MSNTLLIVGGIILVGYYIYDLMEPRCLFSGKKMAKCPDCKVIDKKESPR